MSSITEVLTRESNYTKQREAETDTITGPESQNLNMKDFLKLLTQELQYQDPTSANQDSKQFISELCQFAQLNVSTETHELLENYTGEAKAQSLLGDHVILQDPNSNAKMAGIVEAVYFDGENSGISVNGTVYSMDYLLYSYDQGVIDAQNPEPEPEPESD